VFSCAEKLTDHTTRNHKYRRTILKKTKSNTFRCPRFLRTEKDREVQGRLCEADMKEYVNYVYFDLFLASFQPANLGESPEVNQRDRQTDRQRERACCEMDKKASGELVVESLFERQIMSGFQLASCRIARLTVAYRSKQQRHQSSS